jgi:EAL domain-containing protein (putative c-di-GMP-specific phosphodiesterase class I)
MIIFFAIIVQTKLNHRVQIVVFISSFSFFFIYNSLENPTSFVEDESGLFNRKGFVEIVRNHLRKQKSFRIVGVKLVGLKYLNQTIGYDNRMNLMIYISNEIRNICGYKNIFRISRTRFAIILPDDVNVQYEVIERIRNLFKESVSVPGSDTEIAVSVYITYLTCPADADNVEDVVDLIETSLSNFNDSDVGKVEKVNRYILAKRRRENQILQILKNAIRKSEFDVYFQPIFSLKKNRFTTAEALIRLKNEELGYIGPDEFIPVAEKNGIILPIGEYVFEQVCRFLVKEKLWEKGIEYIHVNLSVVQCMQDKLYRQIISIMDAYNLDYSFINFEVTETAAIVSKETLLQNMNELMKRKIFFSLDDYGTGFSNTASLVNYPFCAIKLDKTLIWAAMEEEKAMSILEHTIKMVKSLGMKVVAEGVETEEQVRILENLDCDYIQGYLFSKPISSKNFVELLNKKRGISETDEED